MHLLFPLITMPAKEDQLFEEAVVPIYQEKIPTEVAESFPLNLGGWKMEGF